MDELEFYETICNALGVGGLSTDEMDQVVLLVKSCLGECDDPVELCGG